MRFPSPLQRGVLRRRYKRFLADVELEDGQVITAHVPNPGAMLGLNTPGLPVWLSISDSKTRKLPHTLELVEAEGGLVGVNTLQPNRLVAEALELKLIPELSAYDRVRREVNYGEASRVDFLLEGEGLPRPRLEIKNSPPLKHQPPPRCWVEVKGVTLHRGGGLAEWPDCVSSRAARHLRELEAVVAEGDRAVVLFVVQRADCGRFTVCGELDPAFARALDHAVDGGVEVLTYACDVTTNGIDITCRMPWAR